MAKVDRTFGSITYAPAFDRRHNFNALASYSFGNKKSWEAGVRWNLGSGLPFTQTVGFYEQLSFDQGLGTNIIDQNGQLAVYYGDLEDLNKGRLPYYHRLDLSLSKKITFSKYSSLDINASVINTYNRANLFYFDRITFEEVNQLPIMPSLGAVFSF